MKFGGHEALKREVVSIVVASLGASVSNQKSQIRKVVKLDHQVLTLIARVMQFFINYKNQTALDRCD